METARRPGLNWQQLGLRVAGAGLLAATGAIHLDLYLTGYRSIPVIGWLFLLQVIAAFGLAAAVLVSGSRLAAAAGAGFALSTIGGYLLSVWIGLFGFKEVRTTAGIVAGVIEVAAFAALAVLAAAAGPAGAAAGRSPALARLQAGVPGAGRVIAGVAAAGLVLLGIAVAGAGGPGPSAAGVLKTAQIGGVTVLTNARGFTLYWFAPDTPAKSNCNASCAGYWPPVTGTPAAGPGVPGRLGTIKRSDGTTQATYDGHPLYTYIGDSAPGQASGNNINLNGGLWHEVTASS
jgi:predicted lipoprotein with Yx(FWY)xxD motif